MPKCLGPSSTRYCLSFLCGRCRWKEPPPRTRRESWEELSEVGVVVVVVVVVMSSSMEKVSEKRDPSELLLLA